MSAGNLITGKHVRTLFLSVVALLLFVEKKGNQKVFLKCEKNRVKSFKLILNASMLAKISSALYTFRSS